MFLVDADSAAGARLWYEQCFSRIVFCVGWNGRRGKSAAGEIGGDWRSEIGIQLQKLAVCRHQRSRLEGREEDCIKAGAWVSHCRICRRKYGGGITEAIDRTR